LNASDAADLVTLRVFASKLEQIVIRVSVLYEQLGFIEALILNALKCRARVPPAGLFPFSTTVLRQGVMPCPTSDIFRPQSRLLSGVLMIRAQLRTANCEPRRRKISCSRDSGSLVLRCAVCADALSGSSPRELSDFHSPVR
jgi:hypothetical protein